MPTHPRPHRNQYLSRAPYYVSYNQTGSEEVTRYDERGRLCSIDWLSFEYVETRHNNYNSIGVPEIIPQSACILTRYQAKNCMTFRPNRLVSMAISELIDRPAG